MIIIGSDDWAKNLRLADNDRPTPLFTALRPWSPQEVAETQRALNRVLPDDMVLFLLEFGSGEFGRTGWSLYHSDELIEACIGPLFVLSDLASNMSDEALHRLYVSRERQGTPLARCTKHGVNVLDLIQFGSDGGCGYQVVDPGSSERPARYFELYSTTLTPAAGSFSEWVAMMIREAGIGTPFE